MPCYIYIIWFKQSIYIKQFKIIYDISQIILINIYAPNDDRDRCEFFEDVYPYVMTTNNKICSYCKCRTDRKYTETNNNVSLF
jgi:hypothetical protein